MSRTVWLGRKYLRFPGVITHWAVKVGRTATSGAGPFGGEPVGKTSKTDREICRFNEDWLRDNPKYRLISDNCQKYAIEFIRWLTNGRYRVNHLPEAADVDADFAQNTIIHSEDGHAFAHAHALEVHKSYGALAIKTTVLSGDVEAAAADSGVGIWVDASLVDVEATIGPVGVHVGPNVNTGIGVRQGNLDVHLVGFGGKLGADGLSIDTPLGGAKCSVM